jgi:hypothetical protein
MSSWRSRIRKAFSADSGLGDETDAFLAGRYLEITRAAGGENRLEPWMWLNALAHGSYERVRELSLGIMGTGETAAWRNMRLRVAQELVKRCQDANDLAHVQHAVLVPLELRLQARTDLSADELVYVILLELTAADS